MPLPLLISIPPAAQSFVPAADKCCANMLLLVMSGEASIQVMMTPPFSSLTSCGVIWCVPAVVHTGVLTVGLAVHCALICNVHNNITQSNNLLMAVIFYLIT